MKILLDIPDSKASSLLDVLAHISYVKTKQLTDSKAQPTKGSGKVVEQPE